MPLICGFISDGYQSTIEGLYNIARNGDKQAHVPAGTGYNCFVHYAQNIRDNKF
jgi:hypothetical protein